MTASTARPRSTRTRHSPAGRFFVGVNRAANAIVGRLGLHRFRGAPLLHLTTTGRTTGRKRTTPLVYLADGDRWIVVASNGGADWEPGWARNLAAGTPASILVEGTCHDVSGTEIDGAERERLWHLLGEVWDYDTYQAEVGRRLAVIALERLDDP